MTFSVRVISDIREFGKIAGLWNCFVRKHTEDPYVLHEFVYTIMRMKYSPPWDPLIFVGYNGAEIVGIAPLMMRKQFGARVVNSVLRPSQCLITDDRFREQFIDGLLELLFRTFKCKTANLIFQTGDSDLSTLEKSCAAKRIFFAATKHMGCRILATEGKWDQFESSKGSNFRNRFRKMEKKLNRSGSCRVAAVECQDDDAILVKILDIDKTSWKEGRRIGEKGDQDLLITWKAAELAARNVTCFKNKAWILELNSLPIAFALVFQNGKTATIAKTSYDARYRNLYPGMYIVNSAIRDLFNDNTVNNIDFVTNLPFMEAWTPNFRDRQQIFLGKGFLVRRALSLYLNEQARSRMRAILKTPVGKLISNNIHDF